MKDKPKDIQYVLPYGESIRGFANQQFIPKTEVTKLLRERGIFVFNNDKSYTVPILQRLLLSPREFDLLRDAYNSREDNFKTISREIVWTDSVTLSEQNNLPIDLDNFIRHSYQHVNCLHLSDLVWWKKIQTILLQILKFRVKIQTSHGTSKQIFSKVLLSLSMKMV